VTIEPLHAGRRVDPHRFVPFVVHELLRVLPPTLYFFIGFNLVLLTKRLFLAEYLIQYTGFFIATTGALIVGKVILVTDRMPFLRRFDYAPLAYPILFKTAVYTLIVSQVRLLELVLHFLVRGGLIGGGRFLGYALGQFSWSRFTATQIWIAVLFLIYETAVELDKLLGDGELAKILFTRRSSKLKSTRRIRIRLLVQLARLTDTYSLSVLSSPDSAAHAKLITILRNLASEHQADCT